MMSQDSTSGEWTLYVPFISSPAITFTEEVNVSVAGRQITIRPDADGYTLLVFSSIQSQSQARATFECIRVGALTGGLNLGCGIRIRGELHLVDDTSPPPDELGCPIVFREGQNLSQIRIIVGDIRFQEARALPRLLRGFEFGLTSSTARHAMSDSRVQLASEIYTDSYFERSGAAQFIGLIGVLEVLKDRGPASNAVQGLVSGWLKDAATLDASEANSLRGSLRHLNNISITQGIRSFVSRHIGAEKAAEAVKLYNMRSSLVHDGTPPVDLVNAVKRAQIVVRDLLFHVLQIGSL